MFESGECVSPQMCVEASAPLVLREEPCLGFHVVGDIVDGAPQRDFSDWPRGVVGQIRGQNADP